MDRDPPPPEIEWDQEREEEDSPMDEMGVSKEDKSVNEEGNRNPSLDFLIEGVREKQAEVVASIGTKEEVVRSVDRGEFERGRRSE